MKSVNCYIRDARLASAFVMYKKQRVIIPTQTAESMMLSYTPNKSDYKSIVALL